jgi:hypothetical protein
MGGGVGTSLAAVAGLQVNVPGVAKAGDDVADAETGPILSVTKTTIRTVRRPANFGNIGCFASPFFRCLAVS